MPGRQSKFDIFGGIPRLKVDVASGSWAAEHRGRTEICHTARAWSDWLKERHASEVGYTITSRSFSTATSGPGVMFGGWGIPRIATVFANRGKRAKPAGNESPASTDRFSGR